MKTRPLIPATLFLVVCCVCFFLQPYSLAHMQNCGLFLLTPDWFREVWTGPHPVSETVASFLVQFYDIPVVGAMIAAALVTLTYLVLDVILRRCRLPFHRLVSLLGALALWLFTARLTSNQLPVTILLIASGVALLSLFLKKDDDRPAPRWEFPVAVVLTLVTAALIGLDARTVRQERLASVEINTQRHRWDKVLQVATEDHSALDPRLMPYAFLALGEKGKLGDHLFKYPLTGPEDFGMDGDNSLTGCLFNSLLSECLRMPNEAIHQIFQDSAHLPHGMSHLALSQLIKYHLENGNYTLARKYARILSHNPRTSVAAKRVMKTYADAVDVADTVGHSSALAPVMTKDAQINLALMNTIGRTTGNSANRFLCYLLLYGDLENFKRSMEALSWPDGKIPVHYQEALLLSEIDADYWNIDRNVLKRFREFTQAVMQGDNATVRNTAQGTYWGYYILIKDKELSGGDSDAEFPAS